MSLAAEHGHVTRTSIIDDALHQAGLADAGFPLDHQHRRPSLAEPANSSRSQCELGLPPNESLRRGHPHRLLHAGTGVQPESCELPQRWNTGSPSRTTVRPIRVRSLRMPVFPSVGVAGRLVGDDVQPSEFGVVEGVVDGDEPPPGCGEERRRNGCPVAAGAVNPHLSVGNLVDPFRQLVEGEVEGVFGCGRPRTLLHCGRQAP